MSLHIFRWTQLTYYFLYIFLYKNAKSSNFSCVDKNTCQCVKTIKKSRTEAKHIKSPSAIVTYKVWQETVFAHFVINKKSNNFIYSNNLNLSLFSLFFLSFEGCKVNVPYHFYPINSIIETFHLSDDWHLHYYFIPFYRWVMLSKSTIDYFLGCKIGKIISFISF